ncbi:MAG: T9SS type A sorting domain-containing protein [Bacteroidetes bacterium]|nr:T9SS type A sorting domain-containing protein [Bacteroidota bacterium]
MKFFLRTLFLSVSVPFCAIAQFNCGNTYAQERLFEQDPSARAKFEAVVNAKTESSVAGKNARAAGSYTIPVVFHVLHKGGSENISDAQLKSAIAILNRDFQKQNSDTANIVTQFKSLAANCSIQFSLASLDPNGKCTNGITRHYDDKTNWVIDQSSYTYTWPSSKYLNVYIVKSLPSGVAGYAYLPGTAPLVMDAIVILSGYVGNIGTGNNYTSRSLTHEVGHWFNLQHTWGSTNNPGVSCGDDGVSDTPITKGHSSCNLNNAVDCTPGVVENIQNYMEYSYCTNMYTQAQKTRIQNCLNSNVNGRFNLSSNSNLIATGVINPSAGCAPKPEFITSASVTCKGNSLNMIDYSYNGTASSWTWSSPFASNTSSLQNGSLTFTASGLAPIQLKVGNSFGYDSITKQIVTVLAGAGTGTVNVAESFENRNFPDSNWIATFPQYGGPFIKTTTVGATGSSCVWANNYFDNANGPISFYSPAYDLSGMSSAQLAFTYAYAQQSATNNDQLKVLVTNNCGASWSTVYTKAGTPLSTTGGPSSQAFLSPAASEWKTETVNLQSYLGSQKLYVKFEFTPDANGAGNNIFIDDINVSSVSSLKENAAPLQDVTVYPNPFQGTLIIKNNGTQQITSARLYDVSSRELYSVNTNRLTTEIIQLDNFSALSSGVYFLEIKSGTASRVIKLIRQ